MVKKVLLTLICCVCLVGALVGCSSSSDSKDGGDKSGLKMILVDKDKKEFNYDLKVNDGMTLREALIENKLITEDQESAMFVEVIDGHSAPMAEGVLWLPCDENGEQIMGMIDEITVKNGQTIQMIYTVAPNYED